jgi:hypothetical protein
MADFLANKIAEDLYQWFKDQPQATQKQVQDHIAATIERVRAQQPNELRPRGDKPCFLKHTDDIPPGEHRWCKPVEDQIKVERCICGAVRVDKDAYPG